MTKQTIQSISEKHGLALIHSDTENIYSVGISTAGDAEIKMTQLSPNCHVIATTVDQSGADHTRKLITAAGLADRIDVRLEDIAGSIPYADSVFDFAYVRLVLHYLSRQALQAALRNFFRVLKHGGTIFVVVRSNGSNEAKQTDNAYDAETCLTTYTVATKKGRATRYFHTQESIVNALVDAGFLIDKTRQYDELLSSSFDRQNGEWIVNNLIEIIAHKP